jgi:hypothetical protein
VRPAAVLVSAAMVSACATLLPNTAPTYVEPAATDGSAKVRVVNLHPFAYYADIAVFDSPTCFTKANLGMTGGNSQDSVRIGMLDDKPVSASTTARRVSRGHGQRDHAFVDARYAEPGALPAGRCLQDTQLRAQAERAVRGGGGPDAGALHGDAIPPGWRHRGRQA